MTITVKQFGLSQKSGSLSSIVDQNNATGWTPYADTLDAYPDPFIVGTSLNVGKSFAAIEFDYGVPTRIASFSLKTASILSLGDAVVIASDNPASSVADTLQAGDRLLGAYLGTDLCSGKVLKTAALTEDISTRYVRILQHKQVGVPIVAEGPDDTGTSTGSNFTQWDGPGAYDFIVPEYGDFINIDVWGGGASGGTSITGQNGEDSSITVNLLTMTAGGGKKSASSSPNAAGSGGLGGTADSTGLVANVNGGDGGDPSPTSAAVGYSGKGGDAPSGGNGGAPVFNDNWNLDGLDGAAPGGGGSGKNIPQGTAGVGSAYFKVPGGGSGAYNGTKFKRGTGGAEPGDHISITVGAGGVSTQGDGKGANGRVKVSWS